MKLEVENLRQLSVSSLEEMVAEIKQKLALLRQKKVVEEISDDSIRITKKNLARVLTVRTEKILTEVVEKYKGTPINKLPKQLRPRLNKAKRQLLTKKQTKRMTRREKCKASKFPRVIYSYSE
ncbi:ribosomal protein L35 [Ordospora colligata]|uniref:Ribosomal protein L35 n=1 Tax=Ordospora colligata OC4 TaxID=1354746 RepID=A0A0B2UD25_9MICR|nr:ribosomal protein L35 [Ordospora colligata OC4]KHN68971.1 ribosomal protein L35 [Ordospora colligata OC4]TBU14005.1 ribosomal protein L35 [Ordospora colligata]TBU14194.1 ribosomal protein L35 [Ordospora colligata]TBU17863.1 ribosomal protein L35 [Ordospora colligata]